MRDEPNYVGTIMSKEGIKTLWRNGEGKLYVMKKTPSKYPFRELKDSERKEFRELFEDLYR